MSPSIPHRFNAEELEGLRTRYRTERDRRIRPDGATQYRRAAGEFGYYAKDPYTERVEREPVRDRVEATVIGGGFGGLLSGAKLRDAGVKSLRMIDEAGDFGGTWYWNRYPGIHCDIEATVYMPLLEEAGYVPKWRYAPGEEIRQHCIGIAKRFELYDDTMFHTKVTELTWDDDAAEWHVKTDRGDEFTSRYVVISSGTLTQPKLPGIPGIEGYRGHTFHTSRWDYGYTGGDQTGGLTGLADKKVAVIGTGATGIQVIPHVAESAEQLFVFQRTPSSVDFRGNRPTDQSVLDSVGPGWQRERMENFLNLVTGAHVETDMIGDGWTATAKLQRQLLTGTIDPTISEEEREYLDEIADFRKMAEIRDRVDSIVTDPETAEKLKPWYRYMCKRPTFSDFYLPTFNRPNVTLVDTADTGGITRMTETGIVVGDTEYEVDCIIFATGFEVGISGVLSGTLPVTGRDGMPLLGHWARGPRTLHGFYSHGFPNLFHLGSMQNAASVNFVHVLQEQATHIGAVVAEANSRGAKRIEPSAEAEQAWCDTISQTAPKQFGFQSQCTPGYYNGEGNPRQVSFSFGPGPVVFHELLRNWRADNIDEILS
ncbi:flavin-containing monooxygenase [Actinoplanes derwentensis]|uniref:Predicted flavoprotein CzcO associated with the cation diffusion facilitator CzcD n=1 Tax=Actinoplanes derwentensis TaxID=113562 RepID=A0A1H1TR16_9ACTN|nr:NAD(P)/FAD-dependent oxidoreductase [Actinoplanes derwentensis]GID85106.1 monooxygenase [Actinoplanes derwentensis]SDS62511.1 Predicted flavoprotein CzcO associated with the cation diffusion facilitator CzcD [Actinoplanes derwentensis]